MPLCSATTCCHHATSTRRCRSHALPCTCDLCTCSTSQPRPQLTLHPADQPTLSSCPPAMYCMGLASSAAASLASLAPQPLSTSSMKLLSPRLSCCWGPARASLPSCGGRAGRGFRDACLLLACGAGGCKEGAHLVGRSWWGSRWVQGAGAFPCLDCTSCAAAKACQQVVASGCCLMLTWQGFRHTLARLLRQAHLASCSAAHKIATDACTLASAAWSATRGCAVSTLHRPSPGHSPCW